MNLENTFARLMRNTGPARVLVPIGLILVIFGCILLGFKSDNYKQTTGTITSVTENPDAENKKEFDVSFTYTAEGKEYEGTFANLSGSFKEGGEIEVYYDPDNPQKTTNSKMGGFVPPLMIAAGVAAMAFGIFQTVKAFKKSKELDKAVPGKGVPAVDFEGFKTRADVTEYYFRFDGNSLKPGYLIEDADRNVLFEGKMLKNALVGARTFQFKNNFNGSEQEHEVGHTGTTTYNNEFFSAKSSFKFDGENIWDLLHGRGIRLVTDMHSSFPSLIYNASKDGAAFARIEATGIYVHEDDEAKHKLVVPAGRMYYRFWTDSKDFELLFLTIFAISETEQAVVE